MIKYFDLKKSNTQYAGELKQVASEVIVPANTYIATILTITDNRLKPVLVEPDINT